MHAHAGGRCGLATHGACRQRSGCTGRIGWLIELDPKYVDVIVRRWQDWSGQEAYREADAVKFNDLEAVAGVAVKTDAAEADA